MRLRFAGLAVLGALACQRAPVISMDFARPELFAAPIPSQDLLVAGHPKLTGYPGRELGVDVVNGVGRNVTDLLPAGITRYLENDLFFVGATVGSLEEQGRGFGLNSGVFFRVELPDDPEPSRFALLQPNRAARWKLPSRDDSVLADSTVFLVDVDASSPGFLHRTPVDVQFSVKHTQYRPASLLSVVPFQGQPLAPGTLHAAVVLSSAGGDEPFAQPAFLRRLIAGKETPELPAEARADYERALEALVKSGVDAQELAGLAVFRTDDPMAALKAAYQTAQRDGVVNGAKLTRSDLFDDYCVYHSTVQLPVYQRGTPPYVPTGGDWAYGADGQLQLQHREEANVWVTLPRRAPAANGFPLVVFIRTGGGGARPLIERGVSDADWQLLRPGSGPAMELAREGYAAITVDGPQGGLRNPLGLDEQVLVFNFLNPAALRDNVRQTAIEQALLAGWSSTLSIDARDCPGLEQPAVRFDASHVALMGHSMGATIAPLVAALEPKYGAVILSGAGASWVENVLYKQRPWPVEELAEVLIGYLPLELDRFDPVLSMVQWAAEGADPLNYNRYLGDRHVLMFQGIVDHYIMPNIANAESTSLALDVGGEYLDAQTPELWPEGTLEASLKWSGRARLPYPISANKAGHTAVVVQHRADAARDGHEVVFQTEPPKVQYRCFLRSWLTGPPVVVDPDEGC
ncbi:MAG: hypothetical protein IPJ65_36155 [Archangiaceae bacterium]|nr:hypothetical protein [Archangiaceae bacterium]